MANIFDWWDLGKNVRIPDEDLASWKNLFKDDWAQRQRQSVGGKKVWNPFRGFVVQDAAKGGLKSGPTPLVRQAGNRLVSSPFKSLMNFGSKALRFPNPVATVLQGLSPTALGGGIDEINPYYENQVNLFNKGTIDPSEFVRPTPAQTNQALAMDSQLAQAQAGNRQTPTTVSPTPPLPSQRNETKFSPTRSTAIKGGRGGRGNVGQRRRTSSPSPVFKSYGPPNRQRY